MNSWKKAKPNSRSTLTIRWADHHSPAMRSSMGWARVAASRSASRTIRPAIARALEPSGRRRPPQPTRPSFGKLACDDGAYTFDVRPPRATTNRTTHRRQERPINDLAFLEQRCCVAKDAVSSRRVCAVDHRDGDAPIVAGFAQHIRHPERHERLSFDVDPGARAGQHDQIDRRVAVLRLVRTPFERNAAREVPA